VTTRRVPSILAAIVTLLLAFAPLTLAGTEEDGGAGSSPAVSVPADVAGTGTGSAPAASVPSTVAATDDSGGDGGDDGEGSEPGASAPDDGDGTDDSSDNSGDNTEADPGTTTYGGILRPVAFAGGILGLTVAGMMLYRRL
jgi:hypothetical protein